MKGFGETEVCRMANFMHLHCTQCKCCLQKVHRAVTVHLPPAVRSLFHRRAGKGAPAKAFSLFWATVTLDPRKSDNKNMTE